MVLSACAKDEGLFSNDADCNSYGYEYSLESRYVESSYKWEDFPRYTDMLPKPDFSLCDGIMLSVAGVLTPTFISDEEVDLADLTVYLQALADLGFTNTVTSSDVENYCGVVYKKDNAFLDYSYKNNVIILTLYGADD